MPQAAIAQSQLAQDRRLREGTALIDINRSDGSSHRGTGIVAGGHETLIYVVTALHVVAGREETWDATRWERSPERLSIEVEFAQDPGRRYRGRLFPHWDRQRDLAVVVVEDSKLPRLGVSVAYGTGNPASLPTPYPVIAIGHAEGKTWHAAASRVTAITGETITLAGSQLGPGFSGGPVLDASRQLLIGMLQTESLSGNRALSMSYIVNRLREWQVPHGLRDAKISAPMVRVPAGSFVLGSRSGPSDASPERAVHLDAYYIDKYEVTTAEFRRFVEDTGYVYVAGLPTCNFSEPGRDAFAMNCVTWDDAVAFARWAGKSLPSEAQWEKAARGAHGLLWPWGNTPPRVGDAAIGVNWSAETGKFPRDISPYGVVDMLGNVSEWVADWYRSDYFAGLPERNPRGPSSGEDRVIRGGSAESELSRANLVRRHKDLPGQGRQKLEYGLRCVLPAD